MREITKEWMKDNLKRLTAILLVCSNLLVQHLSNVKVNPNTSNLLLTGFCLLLTGGFALWLVRYDL